MFSVLPKIYEACRLSEDSARKKKAHVCMYFVHVCPFTSTCAVRRWDYMGFSYKVSDFYLRILVCQTDPGRWVEESSHRSRSLGIGYIYVATRHEYNDEYIIVTEIAHTYLHCCKCLIMDLAYTGDSDSWQPSYSRAAASRAYPLAKQ